MSRASGWLFGLLCAIALPVHAQTVEYIHTDALGTPVAVTDANRNVIERSEYEPYGKVPNRAVKDGPGYTGHVEDAATGLTYMEQRYYDPGLGRFLSVDPITADSGTGANFNRYWYASNNPYSKIDPDGRRDVYIGGGFDKNGSRIVQDYAARQQQLHPGRDIQYFGHADTKQIQSALAAPLSENEPLNVIGHSLGGSEAISQANDSSAQVTNLITIDPVGASDGGSKPSNVSTWTNVTASPSQANSSDVVAYAGRRLEGTTDTSGADTSQSSSANHGSFPRMMSEANALQKIESSYPEVSK